MIHRFASDGIKTGFAGYLRGATSSRGNLQCLHFQGTWLNTLGVLYTRCDSKYPGENPSTWGKRMIWLILAQMSFADIVIESKTLQQGEPISFKFLDDISSPIRAATVRMEVRPGLTSSSEWTVGITDQEGRIAYTPKTGGLHRILVGQDALTFRVRWMSVPWVTVGTLSIVCLAPLLAALARRRREQS